MSQRSVYRDRIRQRNLEALCEGVYDALDNGHNGNAVKVAILKAANQPTLAALAREWETNRPHLTMCLGLTRPARSVRRRIEFNLMLPAGGMERVWEILEDAQTEA